MLFFQELRLNNNKISKLPVSICNLNNLRLLDVSNNKLKKLPEDIGVLSQLQILSVKGNKLNCLPTSICKLQLLDLLECDTEGFIYPPQNIVNKGTDCLIKYICDGNVKNL